MSLLKLYDSDNFIPDKHQNVITDVEEAFKSIRLRKDEITCNLLKYIEKAEYFDDSRVVDRFGTCIYTSEISTGCKAALCLHYLKDCIIDLRECGINARDYIVLLCNEGSAIFYFADLTVNQLLLPDKKISVSMDDKIFDDVVELNMYLQRRGGDIL